MYMLIHKNLILTLIAHSLVATHASTFVRSSLRVYKLTAWLLHSYSKELKSVYAILHTWTFAVLHGAKIKFSYTA